MSFEPRERFAAVPPGLAHDALDARIDTIRYRFPLLRPMRFAGGTLVERCGIYAKVTLDGRSGVGEVAPMPGVHAESVEECDAILRGLTPAFLRGAAADESLLDALPSCVAFGLSCAFDRIAGRLLDRPLRPRVGVNGLFAGDLAAAWIALGERRFEGFRTIKVKVASPSDRATVDLLLASLPAETRLRLDANRAFGLDEAIATFRGLDPARIEYVEEPLADPLALPAFHHATGLALALDESLLDPLLRSALETAPGVVAHVLKPSLHGRIARVRERAERTARQGLATTLSNALETGYTLRLLAALATWLPGPADAERDHGLGSGGMLVGDQTALTIEGGGVDLRTPAADPPGI